MSVLFSFPNSTRLLMSIPPVLMAKPGATMTAWINPTVYETPNMGILAYAIGPPPSVNSSPRFATMLNNAGVLRMEARALDGDTTRTYVGTAAVPLNVWTFVACSVHYGTRFGKTYINGELDSEGVFNNTFGSATSSNTVSKSGAIGGNPYGDAPQFTGSMEDVRCYGRVLGPHEIQTLFAARGADGIVVGLEARYPLREKVSGAVILAANVGPLPPGAGPVNSPTYGDTITRGHRHVRRSR